jgi:hypothetical protein
MTIFRDKRVDHSVDKAIEWKIKFLKATSSIWFVIVLVILSYLLVVFTFFISRIPNNFECKFGNLTAIKMIHNVLLIFIYILTLISFAIDLIGNYSLILKLKWFQYIFKDPYYFRAQILLYIPFMIYSLITEIYTLVTTLRFVDIIKNYQLTMTFNTVSACILLLIDVILPLVVTIIFLYKNCGRKPAKDGLETILDDPNLLELFGKHCEMEYAIENLAAYMDIMEFKKSLNDPLQIYFKYFNGPNSPMEVNVSKSLCVEIFNKLQKGDVQADIFDQTMPTLKTNMADTYSRFSFSSAYVKEMKKKSVQQELLEGTKN